MPIRNPFARRLSPGVTPALRDEKSDMTGDPAHPGFERVETVGSGRTSTSSIFTGIRGGRRSQDTGEYKMSGMSSLDYHLTWVAVPSAVALWLVMDLPASEDPISTE
jgi:hypothetical protein